MAWKFVLLTLVFFGFGILGLNCTGGIHVVYLDCLIVALSRHSLFGFSAKIKSSNAFSAPKLSLS